MSTFTFERVQKFQKNYDFWRKGLKTHQLFLMALSIATLTGVAAQIKIYLPYTPVPVTLQSFVVLLAGVTLGKNWGGISQILYLTFGACGIPWFSNATGGFAHLAGPTAGYLFGFVLAAFFIGWVYDKNSEARRCLPLVGLMIFTNLFIIYGCGVTYLAIWLKVFQGASFDLTKVLWMGFLPFLFGDLLKILLASFAGSFLSYKK